MIEVALSIVTSLNGLTTNEDQSPSEWASKEDQEMFEMVKKRYDVIGMGSGTYKKSRRFILNNLTENPQRTVLTHSPEIYTNDVVPNKLEFLDLSPEEFLEEMERRKKERVLLVSGHRLNGAFFRKGLIDEVYQTIEPVYFNSGLPIAENMPHLALQIIPGYPKKLNDKGTLFAAYDVIKGKK